jgi:hypothetical protein
MCEILLNLFNCKKKKKFFRKRRKKLEIKVVRFG